MPLELTCCCHCCLRYLESCTGPALKRKSNAHSFVTSSSSSSTSEDDKPVGVAETAQTSSDGVNTHTHTHLHATNNCVTEASALFQLYAILFPRSGAGQWGLGGAHGGSGGRRSAHRHHPVNQSHERCLRHQPVFLQQHHRPRAAARIGYRVLADLTVCSTQFACSAVAPSQTCVVRCSLQKPRRWRTPRWVASPPTPPRHQPVPP